MRHNNKQGIAYSVFPFGSSRQMFLVAEPDETAKSGGRSAAQSSDYPRKVRNLLEKVKAVCEEQGFTGNVAILCHFFIADIGMRELVRQIAYECFTWEDEYYETGEDIGAITFVPQAPASGAAIALELWIVSGEKPHVICSSPEFEQVALAEFDEMRWFFGGSLSPFTLARGAYNRSRDAFSTLNVLLRDSDFHLHQLLRTWIYQGHLVLEEGETQRYKELNRARTNYFDDTKFLKKYLPKGHKGTVYPASTGIGADDFDVVISAVALDTKRKDVIAVPLENPNQTSAFDYGEVYSPQSPKFSRAMAVAVDNLAGTPGKTCLIFVSGTASITDSESQHIEDPAKQTEQTLDNIAALIDGSNLARHGITGMSCGLENLECVRVYVKRQSELEAIRQVCEKRLPADVPVLYTIADVCRPELLVEIEGVAVCC